MSAHGHNAEGADEDLRRLRTLVKDAAGTEPAFAKAARPPPRSMGDVRSVSPTNLNQLIRESHQATGRGDLVVDSASADRARSMTATADLRRLVHDVGRPIGAWQGPQGASVEGDRPGAAASTTDIRRLIQAAGHATRPDVSRHESTGAVTDIKAQLPHGQGARAAPPARAAMRPAAPEAASVQQQVNKLATATQPRAAVNDRVTFGWLDSIRKPALIVALVAAALFTAERLRSPGEVKPVVAVSLKDSVQALSSEVADYRKRNGHLPEALHLLSGFPVDALELPSAYYSARLLEDRVELFYTKLPPDRFSIVGRRGEEAWAFVDGTPTPLRQVPAH